MRSWKAALALGGLLVSGQAVTAGERPEVLSQIEAWQRRVRGRLAATLKAAGFEAPPVEVFLRVFKHEGQLECWGRAARSPESEPMRLIKSYKAHHLPRSDLYAEQPEDLGPKRRQGDFKVPEGAYRLLYHNPWSSYHLSLAVGYPNLADAIRGEREGVIQAEGRRQLERWWSRYGPGLDRDLLPGASGLWDGAAVTPMGGEIFIHGKEVTIGCIPIGDEGIEELFVLTDPRRVGGTAVHIFPCRMDDARLGARLKEIGQAEPRLDLFWRDLEAVYRAFETRKQVPSVTVDPQTGLYRLGP
jgi:murein L,D-transpeptidase YafK